MSKRFLLAAALATTIVSTAAHAEVSADRLIEQRDAVLDGTVIVLDLRKDYDKPVLAQAQVIKTSDDLLKAFVYEPEDTSSFVAFVNRIGWVPGKAVVVTYQDARDRDLADRLSRDLSAWDVPTNTLDGGNKALVKAAKARR